MKRRNQRLEILIIIGILIVASMTFAACHHDIEEGDSAPIYEYENTILLYMCGSDLETNYGSCTDNIAELLSCSIDDDTAIIIETGGAKKWRNYDIPNNQICRYIIQNNELCQLEVLDNSSMGASKTLASFLDYSIENYSARNMGLIFWDHGGGGISGVCFDENYSYDGLDLNELDSALSTACTKMGKKFDLVGFDACLMADIDTASVVNRYANYMVASEELEPLGGWDYTNLGDNFASKEGYQRLLSDYANKCEADGVKYYTLSLIDFGRFDVILNALDVFTTNILRMELSNVARSADRSMVFGEVFYEGSEKDLIDLGDFAGNLYFGELVGELSLAITAVNGDYRQGATGMSIYYPVSNDHSLLEQYLEVATSTNYKSFILNNYSDIPSTTVQFIDKGKVEDNKFFVQIAPDTMKYVKDIEYKLYELDVYSGPNGGITNYLFYCLGYDNDIAVDNGKLMPNINGKWVKWNGEYLTCVVAYKQEEYTYFDALVKKNGVNGVVRFSYSKEKQLFDVVGFIRTGKGNMSSRLEKIEPTDIITILHDDRTIDDRGQFYEGSSFAFGETQNITAGRGNSALYYIYLEITDIYGNVFRSNTALYVMGYNDNDVWEINILSYVDEEFSKEF